jgi:glycosyltransferase involved in cell wall biosynthesis
MNIAIAGVITKEITSYSLGGTEAFTYLLIQGLLKKGHNVTLYCAKGSQSSARQVEICTTQEAKMSASNVDFVYPYTILEMNRLLVDAQTQQYDIVHINFLKTFIASFFAAQLAVPVVHTMHKEYFQIPKMVELYHTIGMKDNEYYVMVSDDARKRSLVQRNCFTVPNGISLEEYVFSPQSGDAFLWLSRIDPLKGPKEAALAARRAGKKLLLCGVIDRAKYQTFFDTEIQVLLSDTIRFTGPAGSTAEKVQMYSNAKAFVFPILWEEPFGLVVVEAMACGTPVVAFARGAMQEIIEDGVSGFLVNASDSDIRGDFVIQTTGIAGIAEGMNRISEMPQEAYAKMRENARKRVEQNFTVEKMVQGYIEVYEKILRK